MAIRDPSFRAGSRDATPEHGTIVFSKPADGSYTLPSIAEDVVFVWLSLLGLKFGFENATDATRPAGTREKWRKKIRMPCDVTEEFTVC